MVIISPVLVQRGTLRLLTFQKFLLDFSVYLESFSACFWQNASLLVIIIFYFKRKKSKILRNSPKMGYDNENQNKALRL